MCIRDRYMGVKYLWKIPFQCADKEIVEQASNLLVSLYSNLSSSLEAATNDFVRSFFKFALREAEEAANKKDGTVLAIKMIKAYMSESEGEKYVKVDKAIYKACLLYTSPSPRD
eukprot:TRINITY_DN26739_c0_g1_i1.p1 TRINITY_DN26739_c0_g1~~TRINITY_DN26739_c0_g1_i1.p1  ORF type:complete len:114 (-),score=42.29 TRINITY_DN26739_c0_g1_i1:52-393(-)